MRDAVYFLGGLDRGVAPLVKNTNQVGFHH